MHPLITGLLLLLVLVAALHDIHSRRIPNPLVITGVVTALSFNCLLSDGMGGLGVSGSLAGLAVGFVLLLPLYLLRAMGAGDVKLMSMIGAFLGVPGVMHVFIYVLLAGGVLALGMAWGQRKPYAILANLRRTRAAGNVPAVPVAPLQRFACTSAPAKTLTLPYGVAIALGTAWYLAAGPFT